MRKRNFIRCVLTLIGLVLIVLSLMLTMPTSVQALCDPVKIMPLGDSITYGWSGTYGGYRGYLYDDLLTAAGYTFDFVGSQTGNNWPGGPDSEHEGHSGWRADEIRDNVYDVGTDSGWLKNTPADIVLLHIGTNDISQFQGATSTATEIGQILDRIDDYETAYSTDVWVILARIISRNDSRAGETTSLNNEIQTLADSRIAAGDKIIVVDMESALTYPGDLDDREHPNDTGYGKMADVWYAALDDFLPAYCSSDPAQESP